MNLFYKTWKGFVDFDKRNQSMHDRLARNFVSYNFVSKTFKKLK